MPTSNCASMKSLVLQLENFFNIFTKKTEFGALVAATTVIFTSAYIGWACAKRTCKRKDDQFRPVLTRSVSVAALHGGNLALERIMDYHTARANAALLEDAENGLKDALTEEHPDFKRLQSFVAKLELSGKEAVAVGILETELERAKKEGKAHEAYEIEMLLVEMYIYKGDFKKALNCECLSHDRISDARRPLYKAIIHIMLDHPKDEALDCWRQFKEIRILFQSPISLEKSHLDKLITNFNDFDKVVKSLKNDIFMVHAGITN